MGITTLSRLNAENSTIWNTSKTADKTVDGKYKTVKLDTIYQIVATLGITLKDFFDDELFDEIDD